jgi:hypothetical protein
MFARHLGQMAQSMTAIGKCVVVCRSGKLRPTSCVNYIDGMVISSHYSHVNQETTVNNGFSIEQYASSTVSKAQQCVS